MLNGFQGVFASKPIKSNTFVSNYPGLLLWLELHDKFDSSWYCPTAVRLPVLDYIESDLKVAKAMELADGKTVRIVLIGDPSHCAPIVNSPRGLKVQSNCVMASCKKKEVSHYVDKTVTPWNVHSNILHIHSGSRAIAEGAELFMPYDEDDSKNCIDSSSSQEIESSSESFWENMILSANNEHCDRCFGKDAPDPNNKMFICSHDGCHAGRHQRCFRSQAAHSYSDWFCIQHSHDKPIPGLWALSSDALLATPPSRPYMQPPKPQHFESKFNFKSSLEATPPSLHPHFTSHPTLTDRAIQHSSLLATPPSHHPHCNQSSANLVNSVKRSLMPQLSKPSPHVQQYSHCQVNSALGRVNSDNSSTDSESSDESDSSSSDSESSSDPDSSSSDSDGDEIPHECAIAQSNSNGRRCKISIPKRQRSSSMQLSQDGKNHIRKVWNEYAPIQKKFRRSSTIPAVGSAVESKKLNAIFRAWSTINSCCGSIEMVAKKSITKYTTIFKSPDLLLRSRFEFELKFEFNSKLIKAHMTTLIQSGRHSWHGCSTCLPCYAAITGKSRATIFNYAKNGDPSRCYEHVKKKSTRGRITSLVKKMILEQAQKLGGSLPVPGGGKNGHYVLPFTTHESFRYFLQDSFLDDLGVRISISQGTYHRALKRLKEDGYTINTKEWKSVARCTVCEETENNYLHAMAAEPFSQVAADEAKLARNNHMTEWQEQRNHFNDLKLKALCKPWLVNVVTWDGMDQSSTNLPHFTRVSKHPDVAHTLQLRVVGAFFFGGPVPCLGFTSFEDVQSKGAVASITTLDRILDIQWQAMDSNVFAPIPGSINFPSTVATSSTSDTLTPYLDFNTGKESDEQPPHRVPFMWPEGLHITFDNTSGDSKNAATFRYLGWLVGIGVYRYITVSNLMVGHTHDIVDQMFSVWSTQLKHSNAPTIQDLHNVFRAKYSSTIYELEKYVHTYKRRSSAKSSSGNIDTTTVDELNSLISERMVQLSNELGVQPRMIRIQFNIDKSWIDETSIPHISAPHNFYIVKEFISTEGKHEEWVVMYTRHLAEPGQAPLGHHYPNVRFGPWTSRFPLCRAIYYNSASTSRVGIPMFDPMRAPPRVVETNKIRSCLAQHIAEKNMKDEQKEKFDELLNKFDTQFDELTSACDVCKQHMLDLKKVGPISRKDDLNDEQVKLYKQAQEKKDKLEKAIYKHLLDDAFKKKHRALVVDDWWMKWFDRVNKVIRPYYIRRQLISTSSLTSLATQPGRRPHPADLPRGKNDPPITIERVDRTWLETKGPPRVGDMIFVRGDSVYNPLWVGKVRSISGEHALSDRCDETYTPSSSSSTPLNLGSAAATSTSTSTSATPSKSTRVRRTAATIAGQKCAKMAAAEAMVSSIEDEITSDTTAAAVTTVVEKRSKISNKRGNTSTPTQPSKRQKGANASKSDVSTPTSTPTSTRRTPRTTLQPKPPVPSFSLSADPIPTSSHPPSAAAAASSSSSSKASSELKSHDGKFDPEVDSIMVEWWWVKANSDLAKSKTITNEKWWDDTMSSDELDVGTIISWQGAKAKFADKEFAKLPECVIGKWKEATYEINPEYKGRLTEVPMRSVICYGTIDKMMTKDHQIKAGIFTKIIMEDLCELTETHHNIRENNMIDDTPTHPSIPPASTVAAAPPSSSAAALIETDEIYE